MRFGVEGVLILFSNTFNVVLISILSLSSIFPTSLFLKFSIDLFFLSLFLFSVHIYMIILCKKTKTKKKHFKIEYAQHNTTKKKLCTLKEMSTRKMISSIMTNMYV